MPSIPHDLAEIKTVAVRWIDESLSRWGILAATVLLALASFGLGRLSMLEIARPPIAIENDAIAVAPQGIAIGGLYVGARGGSAYYYPWCTGATKILPQNRVWFQSEDAAHRAGYAPARNCKGLVQ